MAIVRTGFVPRLTAAPAVGPFAFLLARLLVWDVRYRARRALGVLPPERQADLGLTLHDIAQETAKPFWRP